MMKINVIERARNERIFSGARTRASIYARLAASTQEQVLQVEREDAFDSKTNCKWSTNATLQSLPCSNGI